MLQPLTGQANIDENKQTLPSSSFVSYQRLNHTITTSQDRDRYLNTAEDVSQRVFGQADQYKSGQSLPSSSSKPESGSNQRLNHTTPALLSVFASYRTTSGLQLPLRLRYRAAFEPTTAIHKHNIHWSLGVRLWQAYCILHTIIYHKKTSILVLPTCPTNKKTTARPPRLSNQQVQTPIRRGRSLPLHLPVA